MTLYRPHRISPGTGNTQGLIIILKHYNSMCYHLQYDVLREFAVQRIIPGEPSQQKLTEGSQSSHRVLHLQDPA